MEQLIMGAVALMLAIAVRRKEAFTWLKRSRPAFGKSSR
jgi:hypothetical protein